MRYFKVPLKIFRGILSNIRGTSKCPIFSDCALQSSTREQTCDPIRTRRLPFFQKQGTLLAISFGFLKILYFSCQFLEIILEIIQFYKYYTVEDTIFGVPPTIGNLSSLVDLTFAQNRLSGQIPNNIGKLVQLRALKLDGNNMSGRIPKSISSRPPDSAPGSRFLHPDGDIRPSCAPGSSFLPGFGLSSIRRAHAIPGFPRRARGLRTKRKRVKR
jgi:hypothetical protein